VPRNSDWTESSQSRPSELAEDLVTTFELPTDCSHCMANWQQRNETWTCVAKTEPSCPLLTLNCQLTFSEIVSSRLTVGNLGNVGKSAVYCK